MSQSQTIELTCPHCQHEFTAEVWTVINVDTEPHLKTDLLEMQLNVVACPACRKELGFTTPGPPTRGEEEPEGTPTSLEENPIFQLAEEVLSGIMPISDAITQVQTPTFLSQLSEGEINAFDDFVGVLTEARSDSSHVLLLARLNFAAALTHANTRPAVQKNCGLTLLRLMPNRVTGVEERVEICNALLGWINRNKEPELWAEVTVQLGKAYNLMFRGNKAENLEQAIRRCMEALEVYTQEAFPSGWAMAQHYLGTAYTNRIKGRKAENIERAIQCCMEALQVRTRRAFPFDWAATYLNLGTAYMQRIKGDKAQNIERAIRCYMMALEVWTREESPWDWAATQHNLGTAYMQRIKGDKTQNIEQAIQYCMAALEVRRREESSWDWVMTQHNLGIAYMSRIKGGKAENIERAIQCYMAVLEVWTRQESPWGWAMTQHNIGIAYHDRVKGERAENLEQAIQCYTAVLEVWTRQESPWDWAMTQFNLGTLYRKRCKGERAENLEQAIQCYTAALEVRTRQESPWEWAMTQCSLVEAYTERIKGEKAENLEQAIRCCTTVFEVYTKEAYPEGWAMAQHLLAKNYYSRIKGEREGNLEQAIRCYMAALEVYTQEVYPEEWAATQNNLGVAYRERLRGEKAENVERAIQCYIAVLEVRTREAFPFDWAATQINLGSAYYSRLKGKKAENIEQTIRCCMAALEIYTQEALPWNWAMAQHNLGSAYLNRLKGEKAENIKQAIQYYRNAIEMRRSLMIWDDVRDSCWHLGNVYRDEEEWEDAYTAYREAIAAMERIRTEALTEAERTRLIRENIDTFEQLVNCCIRAGRINEAVEYAERGRARNLMEHLIRRDLRWRNVPKSLQDKYEELLSTARNLESLMQRTSTSTTRQPFTTEQVAQIRDDFLQTNQEIEAVLTKIRAIEDFLLDAEPLRFADMQQLAREAQATIIQLMVTQEGTFAFIITGAGEALDEEDIIRVPTFTSDSLSRLVADDWLPSYNSQNEKVWFSCIEQTIEELYTRLFAPIHRRLKELDVRRIVLIPNRGLGILPLHAMSYRENGKKRYLLDDYEITYAPSCGILRRCLDRENEERKKEQFVGVANPTEDLDFSSWEVALIQQHLASKPARVLMGKQATKSAVLEAMPNANLHHFACHGAYKLENPLESRLALADGELTLGEIFASYDAGQAWLVVLSACETGLTDNWRDVSDEYVGLPAGFLYAGAPSVVASLWKIRDFSSALLVTRMYENLLNRDMGRAEALRETQIWLRDLKKEEAEALLQEMAHLSSSTMQMRDIVLLDETEANKTSVDLFAQALSQVAEEEFPEHPYYWAGFQCVGAF